MAEIVDPALQPSSIVKVMARRSLPRRWTLLRDTHIRLVVSAGFPMLVKKSSQVDEISEQEIRALVKTRVPRLLQSRSRAFLVEEMEVCSGRARIDLAVIGDHLIGIEIKGPKDDVSRLPGQVKAYSECFDLVVLVVHEDLAEKARLLIPAWWGLVVGLQKEARIRYRFERRPQPNPNLNLERLLSLLWRDEIDSLLSNLLGVAPKPRATKKSIRAELLAHIDASILRHASLQKLRERTDWRNVPI